jgi:hypothetical protein
MRMSSCGLRMLLGLFHTLSYNLGCSVDQLRLVRGGHQ